MLGGGPLERPNSSIIFCSVSRRTSTHWPRRNLQAVGAGEQRVDLLGGERLAVECDAHLEIEQRFGADARAGVLVPIVAVARGRDGRPLCQAAGSRTITPAASS